MNALIERAHDVLTERYLVDGGTYMDERKKLLLKQELIRDLWYHIWNAAENAQRTLPHS